MNPNDSILLSIVHSVVKTKKVYTSKDETYYENKEVTVKQIKVKKWFKKESIISVEEYVTSKNKISKTRSIIFDKFSSRFYATFHSPKEILTAISASPMNNPIGYKHGNHIYPRKSQVQKQRTRWY